MQKKEKKIYNEPGIADVLNRQDAGKDLGRLSATKILSILLCLMLTVSMAFGLAGCGKDAPSGGSDSGSAVHATDSNNPVELYAGVVGEGAVQFPFEVVDADGTKTIFEVHTDQTTVGAALLENNLISGEDGQFGLYVKEVNGIVADYDVDQTYWAFYIDGQYAVTGVDVTEIAEGSTYMFKVEK